MLRGTARRTDYIICKLEFKHPIKLISDAKSALRVELNIQPKEIGTFFKVHDKEFFMMLYSNAYIVMCETFEHGHELINISCLCPEEISGNLSKITLLACGGKNKKKL